MNARFRNYLTRFTILTITFKPYFHNHITKNDKLCHQLLVFQKPICFVFLSCCYFL